MYIVHLKKILIMNSKNNQRVFLFLRDSKTLSLQDFSIISFIYQPILNEEAYFSLNEV